MNSSGEIPGLEDASGGIEHLGGGPSAGALQPQGEPGVELARRLRRRWTLIEVAASVVGAFAMLGFLHAFHAAEDQGHPPSAVVLGIAQVSAYLAIALPLGWLWREHRTRSLWRWVAEDRAPLPRERDLALREPLREIVVPATLWAVAAVVFAVLGVPGSGHSALRVALSISLGGLTTCAVIYLLVERLLRPLTARALAAKPPERPVGHGVAARLITTWMLTSGIPLLGLGLLAVGVLGGEFENTSALAIAMLVLTGIGLFAGLTAAVLSAQSISDPISAVRRALARVHHGQLKVAVAVDDGSEIGLLQAGFNEMVEGLRERERVRDLFGRHVGEDVARRALSEGTALGGEVREVAALFVDLVGSTALAVRRPPEEVVTLLNRFFAIVVEVVAANGGWVNRFEGDGALCVFGAPTDHRDAAARALAAARMLDEHLRRELPELAIGIGVSAGPAVAGNVGANRRLEYTVIGDPVNEAARLCDLAKRSADRVLASGAALERASAAEAARWKLGEETVLRGRRAPTQLAIPGDHAATSNAKAARPVPGPHRVILGRG